MEQKNLSDMPSAESLIVRNAHIVTMDAGRPTASALVIVKGRIQAVGSAEDIDPYADAVEKVLDAEGATVLPGFVDTHAHFTLTGLGLLAVDLGGMDSIAMALDRIAKEAAGQPANWLLVALNFQPDRVSEKRFPLPDELDRAAGGRPVYVMESGGHWSAVNQAALTLLRLPPNVEGMQVGEDGRFTGQLSGEANTHAFTVLWKRYATQMGLPRAFDQAAAQATAGGITTIHAMEDLEHVRAILDSGPELPVRIVPYTQTKDVVAVKALGLRQIGGCGQVMVDGDFGPHTAALLEPYEDDPQTRGKLYYEDEELTDYVLAAHRAGLQVALHSIGSAAIEQLLKAYELALSRYPRPDHRHRIEHFELPAPGQIERAARLGVALALQPSFNHFWPHHTEYPHVLGWERAQQLDPLRSLVAAGLPIALGSDSPVTPMNAMLWVHSAVNHSNQAERVTVATALRLASASGSWLGFEEDQVGSLTVGKRGDVVFLDLDPLSADPEKIKEIRVLRTVCNGRVAYEA
jgi:predicted amidohydrolase YtcJ